MIRTILAFSTLLSSFAFATPKDCSRLVEGRSFNEILNIQPRFTIEYSGSGRFACAECFHEPWTPNFDTHLHSLRFSSIVLTDIPEFHPGARLRPAQRVILQAFGKVASGARVVVLGRDVLNVRRAIESLSIQATALDLDAWDMVGESLSYRPPHR